MNHIYKSIFSKKTGTYVAVSEHTKNSGKASKNRKILALTALSIALAGGGTVCQYSTSCNE